jgi:hypothetical protein
MDSLFSILCQPFSTADCPCYLTAASLPTDARPMLLYLPLPTFADCLPLHCRLTDC